MFGLFDQAERYRDERFWSRQSQKLFPSLSVTYLRRAELSTPMQLRGYGKTWGKYDHLHPEAMGTDMEQTRRALAALLNAAPENVYLTTNTTQAAERALQYLVVQGKFKREDEIITTDAEYGSITRTLEDVHGASAIRYVKADASLLDRIASAVTSRTRAIVVSYVTHASCAVLPVKEIAAFGRERGIYTMVDAAQAIGQIPVDVREIDPDILIGCGHKWLNGDLVSGILYISDRIPGVPYVSDSPWSIPPLKRAGLDKGPFATYEDMMLDYDGPGNGTTIVHLGRVLQQHAALGWENEFQRVRYLGDAAQDMLRQNPSIELIVPEHPAPGMIAIRLKGKDQEDVQQRLTEEFGICVTHKKVEDILRVATSPFNTMEEIERLDEGLRKIAAR